MMPVVLIIGFSLLCTACNSIKTLSIINFSSPDIFLKCKLNGEIGSYKVIENDDGIFAQFHIENEVVLIIWRFRLYSGKRQKIGFFSIILYSRNVQKGPKLAFLATFLPYKGANYQSFKTEGLLF
jgi:hypothetical protein